MKSSVTISLVPEARASGPFVFWGDLEASWEIAARLGYDAVEIFAPGPEAIDVQKVHSLMSMHSMRVAALGTGGGWVRHKLTLTHSDPAIRTKAVDFIKGMVDVAAPIGAAIIIGSMQGRWEGEVTREKALQYLAEGLDEIGIYAEQIKTLVFYEFLNRYETNILNTVGDSVAFLKNLKSRSVKILADLFHMNIEEQSLAEAIRAGGDLIGHVHFVDSNRRAAGLGHTDFGPVISALREIKYTGYLSAEALPRPNSEEAARQTISIYKKLISTIQ